MRIAAAAVIFDYGCVLSLPQAQEDVERMAGILEAPTEEFSRVMWKHRLAYDRADLSPAEYWRLVARECSRPLSSSKIEALVEIDAKSWARPHPVTPRWADELRAAGLRTAILSNMPAPIREYLDARVDWLPRFDHRTFSCDVRCAKPLPEIYQSCLEGLRTAPGQTVFLDDREENVLAAEQLGIEAVLFRNVEEAARELQKRFAIPPPQ